MSGLTWMVILKSGDRMDDIYCYGPFDDEKTAQRFADFLTKEVDPAIPRLLRSPTVELMGWLDWSGRNVIDDKQ